MTEARKPGIRNIELRIASNLFVSLWHYQSFGWDADALDIDLFGRCRLCYRILYLVEGTSNPDKPTGFTEDVARRLGARPLLLLHDDPPANVLEIRDLKLERSGGEEWGRTGSATSVWDTRTAVRRGAGSGDGRRDPAEDPRGTARLAPARSRPDLPRARALRRPRGRPRSSALARRLRRRSGAPTRSSPTTRRGPYDERSDKRPLEDPRRDRRARRLPRGRGSSYAGAVRSLRAAASEIANAIEELRRIWDEEGD